jgi:hypothetical protein
MPNHAAYTSGTRSLRGRRAPAPDAAAGGPALVCVSGVRRPAPCSPHLGGGYFVPASTAPRVGPSVQATLHARRDSRRARAGSLRDRGQPSALGPAVGAVRQFPRHRNRLRTPRPGVCRRQAQRPAGEAAAVAGAGGGDGRTGAGLQTDGAAAAAGPAAARSMRHRRLRQRGRRRAAQARAGRGVKARSRGRCRQRGRPAWASTRAAARRRTCGPASLVSWSRPSRAMCR